MGGVTILTLSQTSAENIILIKRLYILSPILFFFFSSRSLSVMGNPLHIYSDTVVGFTMVSENITRSTALRRRSIMVKEGPKCWMLEHCLVRVANL